MEQYVMLCVFIFILGTIVGSFLNVCIYRIPLKISVADSYSRYPSCGVRIHWRDLIPVISYLFLKGSCRHCNKKISPGYPFIELLNAVCWLCVYNIYGFSLDTLFVCALISVLIIIAAIDMQHLIIPDSLNVFIFILALPYMLVVSGDPIYVHIIGAFAVSLPLFAIAVISKGNMGGGDVKLMAAAGLFVGYKLILFALLVGSVVGTVVSLFMIMNKKAGLKSQIPFGPYLTFGIATAVLFGYTIIDWYLMLLYMMLL